VLPGVKAFNWVFVCSKINFIRNKMYLNTYKESKHFCAGVNQRTVKINVIKSDIRRWQRTVRNNTTSANSTSTNWHLAANRLPAAWICTLLSEFKYERSFWTLRILITTFSNTHGLKNHRQSMTLLKQLSKYDLFLKPGNILTIDLILQQLYVLPTLYLCVLCLSESKQRLVPLTA